MNWWKALLVILPMGVVAGLVAARMVDPGGMIALEQNVSVNSSIQHRQAVAEHRRETLAAVETGGAYRSGTSDDWDPNLAPGDATQDDAYGAGWRGDGDRAASYYGDSRSADLYGDDYYPDEYDRDNYYRDDFYPADRSGRAGRDASAWQAGQAAERVASEAARLAEADLAEADIAAAPSRDARPQSPSARRPTPAEPTPAAPVPAEPRSGDGDLPAIW